LLPRNYPSKHVRGHADGPRIPPRAVVMQRRPAGAPNYRVVPDAPREPPVGAMPNVGPLSSSYSGAFSSCSFVMFTTRRVSVVRTSSRDAAGVSLPGARSARVAGVPGAADEDSGARAVPGVPVAGAVAVR